MSQSDGAIVMLKIYTSEYFMKSKKLMMRYIERCLKNTQMLKNTTSRVEEFVNNI
jgi:hypothetical protein